MRSASHRPSGTLATRSPRPSGRGANAAGVRVDVTVRPLILVVDDEPLVRAAARRALSGAGYDVLEAGSVADALALLRAEFRNVHLVISDVGLPDGLGPTLLREAGALCPGLPTLLMSGDARLELIRRGRVHAEARLLSKPISGPELLDVVDSLLASDDEARPRVG